MQTRAVAVQLRYEDNQETLSNFVVLKMPSSKGNIEGYGSQQDFLTEVMKLGLLGKQAYTGARSLHLRVPPCVRAGARACACTAHSANMREMCLSS